MGTFVTRFRKDVHAVLWVGLGVFLLLALASYSPVDPSFSSSGHPGRVTNLCGYFGSFLADILFQLLGLAAWALPVASVRFGWLAYRGFDTSFRKTRVLWLSLLVLVITNILGLYFHHARFYSDSIPVAGALGLAISSQLVTVFNTTGAGVVLWSLSILLIIFYTQRPLDEAVRWISAFIKNVMAKMRARAQSRQREQPSFVQRQETAPPPPTLVPAGLPLRSNPLKILIAETKVKASREALKIQRKVENWEIPTLSLLREPLANRPRLEEKDIRATSRLLEDKMAQFDVTGEIVGAQSGPAVTMYEFKPSADVKVSKVTELADDLALALSSESIRILAPIPGRNVVGIETANPVRETVFLKEVLQDAAFWDEKNGLPLALGRTADGAPKVVDLRKMPHLLVAGTTGSGKSVFIVSILTGLLLRHSPKTLRLILIDPKQVDLAAFSKVPHLLMPPINEGRKAVNALRWAISEMEKRYRSMKKFGARNIEGFNETVKDLSRESLENHQNENQEFEQQNKKLNIYYYQPLPFIVLVVEEFGDLMAVDSTNVEQGVVRLAQMARACGIHLVLAMQSPRRDVVTGLIKTNIPGRISFKVASKMDSRIILDESGAERLLANGDMLFLAPGVAKPTRNHGPFLSEDEIQRVTEFWSRQAEPQFDPLALRVVEGEEPETGEDGFADEYNPDNEERYDEILAYVSQQKEVSASLLQRKFRLGYPRAARMIEILEKEGIVGPANGSKPREVLLSQPPA